MIDIPGDLVGDLLCMQQASYLEGGPLMPLYLHVNQKSDYDMMKTKMVALAAMCENLFWFFILIDCVGV